MEQKSLFETGNELLGFRLSQVEVYNWGTFDQKIWTISPDGLTSLLTGANGSGKSTLVDAILTLLVPPGRRNYNLSSGSEKKERGEKSYTLGAYGNIKSNDSINATTQYLRDKNSFSVLKASFKNEILDSVVTVFQCFWHESDTLKKTFGIASKQLDFQEHFTSHKTPSDLKRFLKKCDGITIYDTFKDYSLDFRRLMGLKSEKALDLFNQIVAIKEIGNLNDFIRSYMLKKPEVEEALEGLYINFDSLNASHTAILKAKRQLDLLLPIEDESLKIQSLNHRKDEIQNLAEAIPFYYAKIQTELLDELDGKLKKDLVECNETIDKLDQDKSRLESRKIDFEVAIKQDSVGQNIKNLEIESQNLQRLKDQKSKTAENYANWATKLDVDPEPSSDLQFGNSIKKVQKIEEARSFTKTQLSNDIGILTTNLKAKRDTLSELKKEIASLRSRKSNIPEWAISLRASISSSLSSSADNFPFVGELLSVSENEAYWEGAIEKVLRPFALQMLVPEKFYASVNSYLHKTNIKGRITYNRLRDEHLDHKSVERQIEEKIIDSTNDDLFHKIEFHPHSNFISWVKLQICSNFNFLCTDDLTIFQKSPLALTSSGLLKKGKTFHEKDDRFNIKDKSNYILGWENLSKIKLLESNRDKLQIEVVSLEQELGKLHIESSLLDQKSFVIHDFLNVKSFDDIDWKTTAAEINKINLLISDLENSSKDLKRIKGELKEVQKEIDSISGKRDVVQQDKGRIENELKNTNKKKEEVNEVIEMYSHVNLDDIVLRLHEELISLGLVGSEPKYELVQKIKERALKHFQDEISKTKDTLKSFELSLTSKMKDFIHQNPEESKNLHPKVEYYQEFVELKDKILKDELPVHEERFRKLLNKSVVNDMASFKVLLEREEDEIRENIDSLNDSLKLLNYGPATFIQLIVEKNSDREIIDFQNRIRDCLPDSGRTNEEKVLEESFLKIKTLIHSLRTEERWRKKVTDVRQWLDFAAVEFYKEDESQCQYYSDSSGLSGGQKAKLAFTILASGVAYQYGLHAGETSSRSFRFVVIDEAFSKSDETNSQYAMRLFQNLGLQVMVVTPLDKIHVAEPYIKRIHFVKNSDKKNYSEVRDITIEEYKSEEVVT